MAHSLAAAAVRGHCDEFTSIDTNGACKFADANSRSNLHRGDGVGEIETATGGVVVQPARE